MLQSPATVHQMLLTMSAQSWSCTFDSSGLLAACTLTSGTLQESLHRQHIIVGVLLLMLCWTWRNLPLSCQMQKTLKSWWTGSKERAPMGWCKDVWGVSMPGCTGACCLGHHCHLGLDAQTTCSQRLQLQLWLLQKQVLARLWIVLLLMVCPSRTWCCLLCRDAASLETQRTFLESTC